MNNKDILKKNEILEEGFTVCNYIGCADISSTGNSLL